MTTRLTVSGGVGWLSIGLAAVIVIWSVDAFVVAPANVNELGIIDLLLCLVIAVTLGAVGLCLKAAKSPWRALLLGFIVSVGLCVLALLKAAQDFNGPH